MRSKHSGHSNGIYAYSLDGSGDLVRSGVDYGKRKAKLIRDVSVLSIGADRHGGRITPRWKSFHHGIGGGIDHRDGSSIAVGHKDVASGGSHSHGVGIGQSRNGFHETTGRIVMHRD